MPFTPFGAPKITKAALNTFVDHVNAVESATHGATQAASLMHRLRVGVEDATIVVVGDSTGDETFEWVYLLAQYLGEQFPAYTVQHFAWSDGSKTYGAATTVSTGTGARVLKVYNGSASGQAVTYSVTNLAAQFPVTPQLVLVNYGYNEGTSTTDAFRGRLLALLRHLGDRFPLAGVLLIGQAAVGAGAAVDRTAALTRSRVAAETASTEGCGFVNVTQRFLDNPTYVADWLQADQLHPSAAGQAVIVDEVKRHLPLRPARTPAVARQISPRVLVPITDFLADEGTPVLALTGASTARYPAWSFDAATQEGIIAPLEFPDSWSAINVYVAWAAATGSGYTGSNNVVRWEVGVSRPPVTVPFPSPAAGTTVNFGGSNPWSVSAASSAVNNSGANVQALVRTFSEFSGFTGRPLSIRVRRLAADGADTLAEDALLRAVYVERAA